MMFYGLRTAIYRVGYLDRAKEWYGVVLGIRLYFDEPFYVGSTSAGSSSGCSRTNPAPHPLAPAW